MQIFYSNVKLYLIIIVTIMSAVHKSKALVHIAPSDTPRLVYKSNTLMYALRSSAFWRVTKLPRRASQALHGHLFVGGQAAKGV